MPESYNLRSLRKARGISVEKCYLRNFSASSSPESFNPKVCLERLKLLECHDSIHSRFILENGRIVIRPKQSSVSNKKFLLKILCTIILLVITSLCWKDYFQRYSIAFVKKYSEIIPAVQNYYSDLLQTHKKILKQYNSKVEKVEKTDENLVFDTANKEFTPLSDKCVVRQLVRDYFVELERNKIQNNSKNSKFFIEEQCKQSLKDDLNSVTDDFYNYTFIEETSLIDYALESQGAKIVSDFGTELYGPFVVNFLKFDLGQQMSNFIMKYLKFFGLNGPNSVLVPWRKPGDCWAFKGSQGRILIELSDNIIITALTIEHLPKEVAPEGSFHSAPKKFSILGVQERGNESDKIDLGCYEYKSNGPSTQTFFVQPVVKVNFKKVEVIFESNHGNKNYTCIYKIRIHGHK